MTQDEMTGRQPMSQDTRDIIRQIAAEVALSIVDRFEKTVDMKVSESVSHHERTCSWPTSITATVTEVKEQVSKYNGIVDQGKGALALAKFLWAVAGGGVVAVATHFWK